MPGRRSVLPLAILTLVMNTALSIQMARPAQAGECLSKPNGPAPSGEHWYYRIDHANNKRQCWRLAPEGLSVHGAASQSDDADAPPPRAQQQFRSTTPTVNVKPDRRPADAAPTPPVSPTATTAAAPATTPWPRVPGVPAFLPVAQQSQAEPQTASADETVPATSGSDVASAADDPSPAGSVAEGSQGPLTARPLPFAGLLHQWPGINQAFVLLTVMLVLLAVTGPILHFTHRQREREVINSRPQRWAPIAPLNAPASPVAQSRVPGSKMQGKAGRRRPPQAARVADPPHVPVSRPHSTPARILETHEHLTYALQQLADRMQTLQRAQSRILRPAATGPGQPSQKDVTGSTSIRRRPPLQA